MCRRFVRTRLTRGHCCTRPAVESVVKKQWCNTQLFRFELVEDVLRVIRSVVATDSGMIATHDEVRAAIVLSNQRMKHRFPRTSVAHCGRHDRKDRARCGIVSRKYGFIRLHTHICRNVVGFRFTDERMQKEPISDFQRTLLYVFMGAMNRIARLKTNDAPPATLLEKSACRRGVPSIFLETRIDWTVDQTNLSSQQPGALIVEPADAGMSLVHSAVHELGFSHFVVTILVGEMKYTKQMAFLIQRHVLKLANDAGLIICEWKRHRDRPCHTVCQTHIGTDRTVVGSI